MYAYFTRLPSIGIDQEFLTQRHRSRDIAFGAPTGIKIPASLHTYPVLQVFRAGTTESNSLPRT